MGWRQVGKPKITESVHNFPLPPVAVDPLSSHIYNLCQPGGFSYESTTSACSALSHKATLTQQSGKFS